MQGCCIPEHEGALCGRKISCQVLSPGLYSCVPQGRDWAWLENSESAGDMDVAWPLACHEPLSYVLPSAPPQPGTHTTVLAFIHLHLHPASHCSSCAAVCGSPGQDQALYRHMLVGTWDGIFHPWRWAADSLWEIPAGGLWLGCFLALLVRCHALLGRVLEKHGCSCAPDGRGLSLRRIFFNINSAPGRKIYINDSVHRISAPQLNTWNSRVTMQRSR